MPFPGRRKPLWVLFWLVGAQGFGVAPAHACGVSTPDGMSACSLEEHDESVRPRWRVAASGLYTSTALRFSGDLRSDETRGAVLASLGYQPSRRLTLQLGLGATLEGQLKTPTGSYDFSAGPTAAVGASWRVVEGELPFVVLTSLLSFSTAKTHPAGTSGGNESYRALDLRVGALAGITLLHVLSPYLVGRLFGGPVSWHYQGGSVTGSDVHHYQVGAGLGVLVAHRLTLFAEGIPLGEQALSAGVGLVF